jgi:hypothetical protein
VKLYLDESLPSDELARRRRIVVERQLRYQQTEKGKAARVRERERKRTKIHDLLAEAKSGGCVDCGRTDLPREVLDFDHVFGPREFSPSLAFGIAANKREIAKCQVRCPTCHALRHYNERTVEYGRNI